MPMELQEALLRELVDQPADLLPVAPADRALLRYADLLTRDPAAVSATDITALRTAGFDDRAIHDACAVVAYFAFVNRIADGLGVEVEKPAL